MSSNSVIMTDDISSTMKDSSLLAVFDLGNSCYSQTSLIFFWNNELSKRELIKI